MRKKTSIFAAIFIVSILVMSACGGNTRFEGRWVQYAICNRHHPILRIL